MKNEFKILSAAAFVIALVIGTTGGANAVPVFVGGDFSSGNTA